MSAYALPGLFPPPIDFSSIDDDSCGNGQESSSHKNIPLHYQDGNYSNYNNNSSNYRNNHKVDDTNSSSSSSNIGCLLNSAAIAVKEAKIDPVRWIQYVTGPNPQHYAHQIGKTLRRRVSNSSISTMGAGSGGSSKVSSVGRKPSIRTRCDPSTGLDNNTSSGSKNSSSCSSNNKSPPNEAIEFELSITFNGRKYTAKRTMQCIMQLRDDLIIEMKRRRQWLTQEQGLSSSSASASTSTSTSTSTRLQQPYGSDTMDKNYDSNLNTTHSSYFDATSSSNNKTTPSYAVQIPEIPPFTGSDDRSNMLGDTGFVGRGFTMLHAMVTSYVPVMEGWLKNVMEIVPQDSECLLNFLWEPATEIPTACCKSVSDSINNNNYVCVSKKFKSSTSLATMGSIKEMDYYTEDDALEDDDDDDDDYSVDGWKA